MTNAKLKLNLEAVAIMVKGYGTEKAKIQAFDHLLVELECRANELRELGHHQSNQKRMPSVERVIKVLDSLKSSCFCSTCQLSNSYWRNLKNLLVVKNKND
jgi:hypothetical protein